ncbi:MAG TPA: ATP-dependent Clp protease ATP-binding subunit ClpX [Dehalococcoidia bacterium]|jgi:ATP-dependent Clp protease ATP-binding subunit ClpX|nr:ATP-dependent Clp protease ATP-binding subunit ClpX [Dehalococcoidia bacterium]
MTTNRNQRCSFCEKTQQRSNLIVAGQGRASVCYECIKVLNQLIYTDKSFQTNEETLEVPLIPKQIFESLNEHVIGQEFAKKNISVAVYNHFKRLWDSDKENEIQVQKSNILLIGPTGSGKTLLAETLARILNVPFAICDATSLTESGYVGEDVENILLRLIKSANWDIEKAQKGIIYIDELDKIARKEGVNRSITRDVSGEGVQQELLKIIEGTVANVPSQGGRKHPQQEFIPIDTKHILFICGGAFDGLSDIVEERVSKKSGFGFLAMQEQETPKNHYINTEDVLSYGFIPELVGRLPIIATLEELDLESLVTILTEPKNSLTKQYQHLFSLDNVNLNFTPEALQVIAEKCLESQTGARSLRQYVEEILLNVMYELPSMPHIIECSVDKEAAEMTRGPILTDQQGNVIVFEIGLMKKSA